MMTGTLMPCASWRAISSTGVPIAGALLQFYVSGTTTPTPVYSSSGLGTALSNPVVADSGGLFAAIYLDPTVTYRMQLQTAGGAVLQDIDPINIAPEAATSGQVNAGALTNVYVSPATLSTWSGVAAALGYTPANKAGDTLTNSLLAFTALATNSSGYLGLPVNEQDAAYTTVLADAGRMVRGNSAGAMAYTVPPVGSVAYPVGTVITFRNVGAGTITLTPGTGVGFTKAGATATAASIALAQGGLCTAIMEASNAWVFSGVGMT
jgi:hypothetical protein